MLAIKLVFLAGITYGTQHTELLMDKSSSLAIHVGKKLKNKPIKPDKKCFQKMRVSLKS